MTRPMWTRLALLAAAIAAAAVAAAGAPAQPLAYAPGAAAKTCSSGLGYRCIKYYANVNRYRLTHA